VEQQPPVLGRRRAFVQDQLVDAQVAHSQLKRQPQILRQTHRLGLRRGRRNARLNSTRMQIVDDKAPRLVRQRPFPIDPVDADIRAAAIETAPAHVAQMQPRRDRAAVELAFELAMQQFHGRLPRVSGASFGDHHAIQQPAHQRDQRGRHRDAPRDRLP
jgi:hypothetical protein